MADPTPGPDLAGTVAAALAALVGPSTGTGLGLGVDVEHHDRWRDPGLRVDALFTPDELARCRTMADVPAQLAGTWCAKEAALKALAGRLRLSLRDVEVVRDHLGRPGIRLRPPDLRHHGDRVRISISRTADVSVAVAVYLPATC